MNSLTIINKIVKKVMQNKGKNLLNRQNKSALINTSILVQKKIVSGLKVTYLIGKNSMMKI